jgi:hypothetical protein
VTLPAASGTMAVLPTATGVLAESAGGTGTTTGYYGFKNRIINGAMVIDQRNAGAAVTLSADLYVIDRFSCRAMTSLTSTAQQSSTAPTGFSKSLLYTVGTGATAAAGDRNTIAQVIEGFNTADLGWGAAGAATVTLSFWVRSSVTGTFGGALANGTLARSYPFTYTISVANTFEYKTITVAGDTSGTWATTNSAGIYVWFDMGCGATYLGTAGAWAGADYRGATGDTKLVATTGATFYITGVQLEKGATATSFDYRPYGTELALCQRYYFALNTANVGSNGSYFTGVNSGTNLRGKVTPPQPMRTAPSLTSSAGATFYVQNGAANLVPTTAATLGSTSHGTQTIFIVSGNITAYTAGYSGHMIDNTGASFLNFSAEL